MAITIRERNNSRQWTGDDNFEMRYVVSGTYSDMQARGMADALAPSSINERYGAIRSAVYKNEVTADPQGAGDVWYVDVKYGPGPGNSQGGGQPGESEWSLTIGTRQVHISNSLATSAYTNDPAAEDYKNAINVVGAGTDLRVDGVDVPEPTFDWQETLYMKLETFTPAYVAKLYAATGKTNASAFRFFQEQEVLLSGVSGQPAGNCVSLTFQFSASPSVTGLQIGDIAGIAKKGWEYLWVRYKTEQGNNTLKQVPAQVNVEQVIETYEFANLGLPDPFRFAS